MARCRIGRPRELMREMPRRRLQAIIDRSPDDLVRLYSYQSQIGWEKAQDRGFLSGCTDHVEGPDHDWSAPYRWMRGQMAERIDCFSGDYPVWAWLKRPSTKPKERRYTGIRENIRITALVPRRRLLISDFITWHSVLNNGLISQSEAEHVAFYTTHVDGSPETQKLVEESWAAIFEFPETVCPEYELWHGSTRWYTPQVCVDRIALDEIVDVREFGNR